MILYIDSNSVYLLSKSFSTILYSAQKDKIDYQKLTTLIGKKRNIYIFINSFFSISEHKTFAIGTKQKDIVNFINDRFSQPDVVCANYNHLFTKGKGAEHKNDIIMTIIKNHEDEKHIKKILEILMQTDLDLSHIYCFDHAINVIGLSHSSKNQTLNINVVVLDNCSLIMVSNTTHYMFGRLIKKRLNESIIETTSKMLAMTLKYMGTTYSFLQNELNITIFSADQLDVNLIKSFDPVLGNIYIKTKILKMPELKFSNSECTAFTELQLLKLAMQWIKYVNNLTNMDLLMHINAHKMIKVIRIGSFVLLLISILYGIYRYVVGTNLSYDDKSIEKQYVVTMQDFEKNKKNLLSLRERIYTIIATDVAKKIPDNSHIENIKQISKIFSKYRKLIFVESYRFNCENCLSEKRKNILYIDFAFFNINLSANFVIHELIKVEKEIQDFLSKNGYSSEIKFQQLSRNKQVANARDVRDTIIVTFKKK